jgi:uncharacterized membrane protein HdeD (DUF308 family)
MTDDFKDRQNRQTTRVRSLMDYAMGVLLLVIGSYFLAYRELGINVFRQKPSVIDYFIGALFVLYGVFRIYRGYKKNYFR